MHWRRTARKRSRRAATDISPSPASRARSSPKCSDSSERRMGPQHDPEGGARILIVDDHEDNVELLRARLESWGYETSGARDGAEALKMIETTLPDLVL